MRRRRATRIEHIGQSAGGWNSRRAPGALMRAAAAALLVLGAGGCSLSWQLGSMMPDESDVTGSITPRDPSPLSPKLNAEDWRRARAAMAVALDLQGNGKPAGWDNPDSGARGTFAAAGQPYVVKDVICRGFLAGIGGKLPAQDLQGAACRNGPDDWTIKDVKPVLAAAAKAAPPSPVASQPMPPRPAAPPQAIARM